MVLCFNWTLFLTLCLEHGFLLVVLVDGASKRLDDIVRQVLSIGTVSTDAESSTSLFTLSSSAFLDFSVEAFRGIEGGISWLLTLGDVDCCSCCLPFDGDFGGLLERTARSVGLGFTVGDKGNRGLLPFLFILACGGGSLLLWSSWS